MCAQVPWFFLAEALSGFHWVTESFAFWALSTLHPGWVCQSVVEWGKVRKTLAGGDTTLMNLLCALLLKVLYSDRKHWDKQSNQFICLPLWVLWCLHILASFPGTYSLLKEQSNERCALPQPSSFLLIPLPTSTISPALLPFLFWGKNFGARLGSATSQQLKLS